MDVDMKSFQTTTYGKWILTGEHTVLRGGEALVFPLLSKAFHLDFEIGKVDDELEVFLDGDHGPEFKALFRAVLDKALGLKKVDPQTVRGVVNISSQIPAGAGLGASAALCVAITRWLQAEGLVAVSEAVEFARQLENIFHGESSGVDVAVVSAEKPLVYKRNQTPHIMSTAWRPNLAISYTGARGVTYDCVQKVKKLFEKNPSLAEELDSQMKKSVERAKAAFFASSLNPGEKTQKDNDLSRLIESMNLALDCFQKWGLADGAVSDHISKLRSAGALALKPTGSGGGGYVLSLWQLPISEVQKNNPELGLISCF
jgi:mevalonate kinase